MWKHTKNIQQNTFEFHTSPKRVIRTQWVAAADHTRFVSLGARVWLERVCIIYISALVISLETARAPWKKMRTDTRADFSLFAIEGARRMSADPALEQQHQMESIIAESHAHI